MNTTEELEYVRARVLEEALEAETGSRESALWLIEEFRFCVGRNVPVVPELLIYFARTFDKILDCEHANSLTPKAIEQALNLTNKSGRASHKAKRQNALEARQRDMLIAAMVHREKNRGKGTVDAKTSVNEKVKKWTTPWLVAGFRKSGDGDRSNAVREAWRKHRRAVLKMPPEWIAAILEWEKLPTAPRDEYVWSEESPKDILGESGD